MVSLLFVCLGNICRSPLAEGIFAHEAAAAGLGHSFTVDSAGTGGWHVGSLPDPRSIAVAARHGIDLTAQRARQVSAADFSRFDVILAMDSANLRTLLAARPKGTNADVRRFLDQDVPDPYYGADDGFEAVFQMIRSGSLRLLDDFAS